MIFSPRARWQQAKRQNIVDGDKTATRPHPSKPTPQDSLTTRARSSIPWGDGYRLGLVAQAPGRLTPETTNALIRPHLVHYVVRSRCRCHSTLGPAQELGLPFSLARCCCHLAVCPQILGSPRLVHITAARPRLHGRRINLEEH